MNGLRKIGKFIKRTIAENDKKGYAKILKAMAYSFASAIEAKGYHIEDMSFYDGYFIFGMGTNTVIHFHIKECPDWKFGVWWHLPENKKKSKEFSITGDFFAQYERFIDKFKPSRSRVANTISAEYNKGNIDISLYDTIRNLDFIKTSPARAYCFSECCYEKDEVTETEATEILTTHIAQDNIRNEAEADYARRLLAWVNENVMPHIPYATIKATDFCSPTHDMSVRIKDLRKAWGRKALEGFSRGFYDWGYLPTLPDDICEQFEAYAKEIERDYPDVAVLYSNSVIHSVIYMY